MNTLRNLLAITILSGAALASCKTDRADIPSKHETVPVKTVTLGEVKEKTSQHSKNVFEFVDANGEVYLLDYGDDVGGAAGVLLSGGPHRELMLGRTEAGHYTDGEVEVKRLGPEAIVVKHGGKLTELRQTSPLTRSYKFNKAEVTVTYFKQNGQEFARLIGSGFPDVGVITERIAPNTYQLNDVTWERTETGDGILSLNDGNTVNFELID